MMGRSHTRSKSKINCPIGLFGPQEDKIEALTKSLNAAAAPSDKALIARELIDEVGILLKCESYDPADVNCGLCRGFSGLRMQTANLILKTTGSGAAP
jgi:hypothetical protein